MAEEPWSWARRMAQGWVTGGAALGWSGTEIISFLREVGLGYRTQDVYEDIRRIMDRGKWEYQITRLLPTSVVPRSWQSQEPGELWHMPGVTQKAVGYGVFWSEEEQDWVSGYKTIGLPREMTIEEIRDYVLGEVEWKGPSEPERPVEWETTGMMHLEGAGY